MLPPFFFGQMARPHRCFPGVTVLQSKAWPMVCYCCGKNHENVFQRFGSVEVANLGIEASMRLMGSSRKSPATDTFMTRVPITL